MTPGLGAAVPYRNSVLQERSFSADGEKENSSGVRRRVELTEGLGTSSVTESLSGEFDDITIHAAGFELPNGRIDVVFDPFQFDLPVFDDGICGTGISIPGLSYASRIQDLTVSERQVKRNMGVSDANEVSFDIR